jgi:hypothetical protein
MFTHLQTRNKPVIILGLNGKVGRNVFVMNFFSRINAIIRPIAEEFGFPHIDITQFIHTEDDLAKDGALDGTHFARPVYAKIADEIFKFLPARPTVVSIAA